MNTSDSWPKHPDGRNKTIGEMTSAEADRVTREAVDKIKGEFAAIGVLVNYAGRLRGPGDKVH